MTKTLHDTTLLTYNYNKEYFLVFRRYAPFAEFGFGFEGDNRDKPSISLKASARTIGIVQFSRGEVSALTSSSSGTKFIGAGKITQRILGQHIANITSNLVRHHISKYSIHFSASTAGSNPMLPFIAPDIDTYIDFSADWIGKSLRVYGNVRGDSFPNMEVFILDSVGVGWLLFDGRTSGGKNTGPFTSLYGSHQTQKLGTFFFTIALSSSGEFIVGKDLTNITYL